jgi:hypothetical protein
MTSIHQVAIRTEDYQRFASFYRRTFGADCPAVAAPQQPQGDELHGR